eukprot:GHVO01067459.1.p2 GENE.GHVO01067459.1~~GHVO01067459.1.p2  ORF type:complete len:106 (-),score=27.16 GHVO01067459.1:66-383(-)
MGTAGYGGVSLVVYDTPWDMVVYDTPRDMVVYDTPRDMVVYDTPRDMVVYDTPRDMVVYDTPSDMVRSTTHHPMCFLRFGGGHRLRGSWGACMSSDAHRSRLEWI